MAFNRRGLKITSQPKAITLQLRHCFRSEAVLVRAIQFFSISLTLCHGLF